MEQKFHWNSTLRYDYEMRGEAYGSRLGGRQSASNILPIVLGGVCRAVLSV
jgi:hypothetical protein